MKLPPKLEVDTSVPAWETQLAVVLTTPTNDHAAKSRAIFALLERLPEEALAEASERAAELLPDADYASVAAPVVTNAETHGRVMSVLFADLMERPDAITLPTLLQIARTPEHPFAPSAIDNLRLLLNADFGTDWTRWASEIHRALAPAKR